jgi:uncharacterized heparinase superfamily protein
MARPVQGAGLAQRLSGALRSLRRGIAGGSAASVAGPSPERLLLAPPDLRTPDPVMAQEIYSGLFHFAGKSVECSGKSPFAVPPPSLAFARQLHSFGWLRHLAGSGGPLANSHAQALVKEWLDRHPRPDNSVAWGPLTASHRLIAWICHSPTLLENADHAYYQLLLRSIGFHIRYLRAVFSALEEGAERLICLTALNYAEICVGWAKKPPRTAQKALDQEIARQLLPDGCHVSRNPAILVELLALFLPLRQTLLRVGVAPSIEMQSAIDRMMPALRFFRLADGGLARFNGNGPTEHDLVVTVLRYDDVMGAVPASLSHGGYVRLAGGETIVVCDTGKPPAAGFSGEAHASALALEFSAGGAPLIVNCGTPPFASANQPPVWRSTAAHSTAVLGETSSCRFESADGLGGGRIFSGPSNVAVSILDGEAGRKLIASHDGYARQFGLLHERLVALTPDGAVLSGQDRFVPAGAAKSGVGYEIRFHVHPAVEVLGDGNDHALRLKARNGDVWRFACAEIAPFVEETVYFAGPEGPRRSAQIVLRSDTDEAPLASWSFTAL